MKLVSCLYNPLINGSERVYERFTNVMSLPAFSDGHDLTLLPRVIRRGGRRWLWQTLALEALGNELMLALGRRMRSDLLAGVRHQRLILGQRLEFGESEPDLSVQAALDRLAGAGEIGINLRRGNLLQLQNSAITVFAVGRNPPMLALACYRE
jgi:hypothetical protein